MDSTNLKSYTVPESRVTPHVSSLRRRRTEKASQPGLLHRRLHDRVQLVMIMTGAETIRKKIEPYFAQRKEVLLAYLFGSVAQGRANRLSDIDIALLVDEKESERLNTKQPYGYKATVIADLMGLLQTNEIDLILLHEAPPLLTNEVISEGSLLFCRDENVRVAFEVTAKHKYIDTKPLRQIKRQYLYNRIDRDEFSKVRPS
ncbi:MAG: nucleotidyltransferase domain-containing protein [Candidatus Bipolaricaulota bacterium]|nr:nucleotidyltransferase domain-containing protein [Candidatus Bipolaricaulota bacterium]